MSEKSFKKRVKDTAIASEGLCTLGFTKTSKIHPKTLLKNNELVDGKAIELLLRKNLESEKSLDIVIGDMDTLINVYAAIKDKSDDKLIADIENAIKEKIFSENASADIARKDIPEIIDPQTILDVQTEAS